MGPYWSNTGCAFGGLRLGFASRRLRPDAFTGTVVAPGNTCFDWCGRNRLLYGRYGAATARSDVLLEGYLPAERHAGIRGEPGRFGTLVVYTSGVRPVGKTGRWLHGQLVAAPTRGRAAEGAVRARGPARSARKSSNRQSQG